MEKGKAFLELFQKLEEYLRRNIEPTKDLPFAKRLDALAQKHPVHRQSAITLKDYGKLRNALVHHRDPGGELIAEPSEQALREFEQIVQTIISSPKLIPWFQKPGIRLFSPQDPLVTALQHMREHDYSQVIVQTAEGQLSLLTVEGIARWLEEQAQDDSINVQEAIIGPIPTIAPPGAR